MVSNTTYLSTNNLLSVDEMDFEAFYDLTIFPNPTNGPLHIQANTNIEKVSVFDISGRLVKALEIDKEEASLDINSLNNGIYFIKIWIGQNYISRKIIKRD